MARRKPEKPTGAAVPSFDEFAARAKAIAAAIPAEFMDGVEDIAIHREVRRHPLIEDVLTLGECEPSRLAAMLASDTVRSIVHLYYGSFVDFARRDETFRLDDELKETIEHEIQHHLEDRAGVRTLIDEDDLFDAHQRFIAGLETPRGWWRRGERLERDVYAVEDDLFVELRMRRADFLARRGKTARLVVLDEPFEAEIPADAEPGEILTFEGDGLLTDDAADGHHGHRHGGAAGDAKPAKRGRTAAHRDANGEHPEHPERPERPEHDASAEDEPAAGDLHLVLDVR